MQLHQYQNGEHHLIAESLLDFIEDAARRPQVDGWTDASMETGRGREEFSGTKSLDDAVELLRSGWREGTERIVQGVEAATATAPPALWPEWEHDVAGLVPDVAAYCAGAPECMATPGDTQDAPSTVIRLYVEGMTPARVDSATMMRHAVAVATHLDAIQRSGRSAELIWIGYNPGRGSNRKKQGVLTTVPIVTAGRALSLAQVAAAYHPAMLRRLWFATVEQRHALKYLGPGFGPVVRPPEWAHRDGVLIPGPTAMYDDGAIRTDAQAADYIGQALTQAGLEEGTDTNAAAAF